MSCSVRNSCLVVILAMSHVLVSYIFSLDFNIQLSLLRAALTLPLRPLPIPPEKHSTAIHVSPSYTILRRSCSRALVLLPPENRPTHDIGIHAIAFLRRFQLRPGSAAQHEHISLLVQLDSAAHRCMFDACAPTHCGVP